MAIPEGSPCSNPMCDKGPQGTADFKKCSRCKDVWYCSKDCQKVHWVKGHKKDCNKKAEEAKQSEAALKSAASGPTSEMQELQEQFVNTSREYNMVQAKLQAAQRDKKRLELTKTEIEGLPEDARTYRAIGKMFMISPVPEVKEHLSNQSTKASDNAQTLQGQLSYLERQVTSQRANLVEMSKSMQAAAAAGEKSRTN